MTNEQFQKLATQVWIFLFGITVGWFFLFPSFFWWLPLFMIVMLIVARELVYQAEKKVMKHEQKSKVNS